MSVQAMSWVIDNSQHKGNSFVVLLMIANHTKSDGTGAWPSIRTLAKEARVSQRTVQRCISRLSRKWSGIKNWQENNPELVVRKSKGPHGSNLYDIPGVKLSPLGGCQNDTRGVTVSDTRGVSSFVTRTVIEPSLKQPSNTGQPRPATHTDEEIRQIEAKQRRLEKEADARKEVMVGYNWMSAAIGDMAKKKAIQ